MENLFNEGDVLYEFWYNYCIHESRPRRISLHITRKGAEIALEYHKYQIQQRDIREFGKIDSLKEWGIDEITISE